VLTNQQIFDLVKKHLLEQNKRSQKESGLCAYRGQRGRKCPVGYLIPDQYYKKAFDEEIGMGVDELFKHYPRVMEKSGLPEEALELLTALQDMHDTDPPATWSKKLSGIAKNFDLVEANETE